MLYSTRFIRLNREKGTQLFNLDNITNVWVNKELGLVAMECIDGKHFAFTKKDNPQEYEHLKSFFEQQLDAHTINL